MVATRTVLVTGATGFIGRATVAALAEAGWQVTQGSRLVSKTMEQGTVYLDLADPATLLALAKGARFDAIVHLGAHVGWSGEAESEMFVPNVLSTGCLAYLASLWDSHLIFASAAIVHGVRNEIIDSDSQICPDTAYAKSKWLGEQLLAASNVKYSVLRIAGVFGCDGPAHLGLNRAIDGAIRGEPPLQIGSGTALRNYVYVKDVAQAIVYTLQKRLLGTHLLSGHEIVSVSDMLQQVCDMFMPGLHPVIKDGPQALNQVITPSTFLPKTRGFREALNDIKKGCNK
ncbi:MAG: NAD(P)-dependent oxidoreductase [Methylotenera sp.]